MKEVRLTEAQWEKVYARRKKAKRRAIEKSILEGIALGAILILPPFLMLIHYILVGYWGGGKWLLTYI